MKTNKLLIYKNKTMKKVYLLTMAFILHYCSMNAQGTWTQKADFGGGTRRLPFGFSIGGKGYIGTGQVYANNNSTYFKDCWEYDPATNIWTQKADFGGSARWLAVGFSIGNKGYIGTGIDTTFNFMQDFWEYDPIANTWIQKADYGGGAKVYPVGFSIGNKGYMGTGGDFLCSYYNDFWEYDPTSNTWTQKADFGGVARGDAVGFSIGTKGYIGTGYSNTFVALKDFWEYDPGTNTWIQKADVGGGIRCDAAAFSIGGKGYIGAGEDVQGSYYNDFWEYDTVANTWTQKTNFGGVARDELVGFSIGNKGYMGTGGDITQCKDFWEYTPDTINTMTEINEKAKEAIQVKIYPNPFSTTATVKITNLAYRQAGQSRFIDYEFRIYDLLGREVTRMKNIQGNELIINRDNLSEGLYIYKLINNEKQIISTGKITIN